ncbi:MAG: hypothetical protein HY955_01050 [Deltaproteobacteria bacterium]|nr:hypothetical protein [Deltaproteobacteria bacterium]
MSGRNTKTRKLIKAAAHVARGALLIVALMAASVYFLWSFKPSLVDSLDSYIVERHFSAYSKRLAEARTLLDNSRLAEARGVLDPLLKDLGKVRKQDRKASYYAEAMDLMLYIAGREGDQAVSLSIARALTEFDPNHYNYWLNLAYILNSSGERKLSIDALKNAFRIAPASIQTTEPLSTLLFEEGRKDEAREVITGFMNANLGGTIAVYHAAEGKEFSRDRTSRLITIAFTGDVQRLSLPVGSSGTDRLRVEFPAAPDLNIRIEAMALATNGGSEAIDFRNTSYGLHDLSEDSSGVLTVAGSRPYVEFKLPEHLKTTEILSIDIDAAFFQRESAGILSLKRELGI